MEGNIINHKKGKKILWCGRLDFSAKRVDRIIDIWEELAPKNPDWELIVIGDGNIEYFKNSQRRRILAI